MSNEDFNNIFDDDIEEMKEDNSSSNNINNKASSNEDASQNLNIRKHNNKKENNSDALKIQKAFNNKNFLRRNNVNNVSTEEETNEEIEQQKENEVQGEQKESLKEKIINKTANKMVKKETKTGATKAVAALAKPLKIKLMLVLGVIVIGLLLAIFLIYLILGPLMDSWKDIDRGARQYADRIEKLSNFYKGFGFEDSKTAFYKELDSLDQFYDYNLDIPLLLSTLFYPETMGYDTAYQEHVDVISSDPITSLFENGTDGFIEYFKNWTKDIVNEAGNTYDDETGLVYNASKIFRLRRLAAAMCTKSTTTQKMSLDDFLRKFDFALTKAVKDFISTTFNSIFAILKETIVVALKSLWDTVTLDFEGVANDWGSYFNRLNEICSDEASSLAILLSVISFGLIEISTIHYEVGTGVVIEYFPYKVDEDKYEEYLKNYYFETTPEFSKLLPESGTSRFTKKDKIMSEINTNTKLFRDIFLPYGDGLSEGYEDSCVGAINNALINELELPVDIKKANATMFTPSEMFGIANGIRHNGVILTKSNVGIEIGDSVKSIARGKVVEIGKTGNTTNSNLGTSNQNNDNSNWVKVEHEIVLDNDKYKFYTIYKYLGNIDSKIELNKTIDQKQTIGTIGKVDGYDEASIYFEFRNEQDIAIDPTNLFIPCKSGAELVGNDNEEKIWNYLTGIGITKAGTAGIMGNWQDESGFEPANLENGCEYQGIYTDESITEALDTGKLDLNGFIGVPGFTCEGSYSSDSVNGRFEGGPYGYGLAQWTFAPYKIPMYKYWKEYGGSIGSLDFQLSWFEKSLTEYNYETGLTADIVDRLNPYLRSVTDPQDAARVFREIYEGNAGGIGTRAVHAQEIYDKYSGNRQ